MASNSSNDLSLKQVTERLECTASCVGKYVQRGLFPNVYKVGHVYHIPEADVIALEHNMQNLQSHLSINQIAERLRCNYITALEYLKRGLFPNGYKQGRVYSVPEADVIAAEQILNETKDHINRSTAAQELGIAYKTINSLIKRGEIETKRNIVGEVVISRSQFSIIKEKLGMTQDILGWIQSLEAVEIIKKGTGTPIVPVTLTKLGNEGTLRTTIRYGKRWFHPDDVERLSKSRAGYYFLAEVAKLLKYTTNVTPLRLIQKGVFPGAKRWEYQPNVWLIPIKELEEYGAHRENLSKINEDPYQLLSYKMQQLDTSGKERTANLFHAFSIESLNKSNQTDKVALAKRYANAFARILSVLERELHQYNNEEKKAVIENPALVGVAPRIYIDFLEYCALEDREFDYDQTLVLDNGKKKPSVKIDDVYTPEEYALIILRAIDMEYNLPNALGEPSYARSWLYMLLNTTNAWRSADFTKISNVTPSSIGIDSLDWFKTNRLTLDQAQTIILEVKRAVEIKRAGKNNAFLRFYCPFDMMEVVATAFVIAELHRQLLGEKMIFPKSRVVLAKKLLEGIPRFGNRRMTYAVMTYINEKSEFLGLKVILATVMRSHVLEDSALAYLNMTNKDGAVSKVVPIICRRGGLHGWMYDRLIDLITDNKQALDREQKTAMIEELRKSLKPIEAEMTAGIVLSQQMRYQSVAQQLASRPQNELMSLLVALIQGKLPARIPDAQCLLYPQCACSHGDPNACLYCDWVIPMQYLLIAANEELQSILKQLIKVSVHNKIERVRLSTQFIKVSQIIKQAEVAYGKKYLGIFVDRSKLKPLLQQAGNKFLENPYTQEEIDGKTTVGPSTRA